MAKRNPTDLTTRNLHALHDEIHALDLLVRQVQRDATDRLDAIEARLRTLSVVEPPAPTLAEPPAEPPVEPPHEPAP